MTSYAWTIRPRLAIHFPTREEARKAARSVGESWHMVQQADACWRVERIRDRRFLALVVDDPKTEPCHPDEGCACCW